MWSERKMNDLLLNDYVRQYYRSTALELYERKKQPQHLKDDASNKN